MYSVSMMALHMQQEGTGQANIDGKRTTNVPAFKSTAFMEYALPALPGLKLNGIWQYSGKKAFDDANTVFVPDYHVFGLGASYATRIGGALTTLRFNVDNVTDKFYWRDVTPAVGGYLFTGAPRTFKLSALVDF
jgi:iron complex outermembrane recepter protein